MITSFGGEVDEEKRPELRNSLAVGGKPTGLDSEMESRLLSLKRLKQDVDRESEPEERQRSPELVVAFKKKSSSVSKKLVQSSSASTGSSDEEEELKKYMKRRETRK